MLYVDLVSYAIAGLILGKIVNVLTGIVSFPLRNRTSRLARLTSALLQVMIIASVPVGLEAIGDTSFVESWQVSLPGLLFASMFLSMQSNLLNTASS